MSLPERDDHSEIVFVKDAGRPEKGGVQIVRGASSQTSNSIKKGNNSFTVETKEIPSIHTLNGTTIGQRVSNNMHSRGNATLLTGQQIPHQQIQPFNNNRIHKPATITSGKEFSSVTFSNSMSQKSVIQKSMVTSQTIHGEKPSTTLQSYKIVEYNGNGNNQSVDMSLSYGQSKYANTTKPHIPLDHLSNKNNIQVSSRTVYHNDSPIKLVGTTPQESSRQNHSIVTPQSTTKENLLQSRQTHKTIESSVIPDKNKATFVMEYQQGPSKTAPMYNELSYTQYPQNSRKLKDTKTNQTNKDIQENIFSKINESKVEHRKPQQTFQNDETNDNVNNIIPRQKKRGRPHSIEHQPDEITISGITSTKVNKTQKNDQVKRFDRKFLDNGEEHEQPKDQRETPRDKKLNIPDFTTKEVTRSEVTDVKKLDRTLFERKPTEEEEPQKPKDKPKRLVISEFTNKEVVKRDEVVQVQKLNTSLFESPEEPDGREPKRQLPKVNKLRIPDFTTKGVTKSEVTKEVRRPDQSLPVQKESEGIESDKIDPVSQRKLRREIIKTVRNDEHRELVPEKDKEKPKDLKVSDFIRRQDDGLNIKKLKGEQFYSNGKDIEVSLNLKRKESSQTPTKETKGNRNIIKQTEETVSEYNSGPKEKNVFTRYSPEKSKPLIRDFKATLSSQNSSPYSGNLNQGKDSERQVVDVGRQRFIPLDRAGTAFVDVSVNRQSKRIVQTQHEFQPVYKRQNDIPQKGNEPSINLGVENYLLSSKPTDGIEQRSPSQIDLPQKQNQQNYKWATQTSPQTTNITDPPSGKESRGSRKVDFTVRQVDLPQQTRQHGYKWEIQSSEKSSHTNKKEVRPRKVDVSVRQIGFPQHESQQSDRTYTTTQSNQNISPGNDDYTVGKREYPQQKIQPGFKWSVQSSQKTTHKEKEESRPSNVEARDRRVDDTQQRSQEDYKWSSPSSQQTNYTTVSPTQSDRTKSARDDGDVTVRQSVVPQPQSQRGYKWTVQSSKETRVLYSDRNQTGPGIADVTVRKADFPEENSQQTFKLGTQISQRKSISTTENQTKEHQNSDVTVRKADLPQQNSQQGFKWGSQNSRHTSISTTEKETRGPRNVDVSVPNADLPQQQYQQNYKWDIKHSQETAIDKTYSTTQSKETRGHDTDVPFRQIDIPYKSNQKATSQSQGTVYIDVDIQHQDGHTWNDDQGMRQNEQVLGANYAQVRKESKTIIKTGIQNIASGSPGAGMQVQPMQVYRQQLPSSGRTWQVQNHSSIKGVKQGQWEQTYTSHQIKEDRGQKISRHTYQTQHSVSSQLQSFYHPSQNSGAIQFKSNEEQPNFPSLVQKDGKWEVRRVSVDDKNGYSPETSMEVKPLERRVTLGARDKNAPQRKELMKEFKQKAQTKTYEDVLEDGTHLKRTIQTSEGTTHDEPGSQTRVQSVREHVVMSKR